MPAVKEAWLIFIALFLIFPYLYWKVQSKWKFLKFEIYVLSMMVVIPISTAIAALFEFGQPIIYGVLAQRNMVLAGGSLFLIYSIRHGYFNFDDFCRANVYLGWFCMSLYLSMYMFLDPGQFAEQNSGFVGYDRGEYHYKFQVEFIVFSFFYYIFIGFRNKSIKNYGLATIFFVFLVLIQGGRILLVSLLVTYVLLAWRWGSFHRLTGFIPKVIGAGFIIFVLVFMTNAEYILSLVENFQSAYSVITTWEESGEASADSRILQTAIAWPYVEKNWLFGNGGISQQWQGGYDGVLNSRFHVSDIGVIGMIYMYGFFGIILFIIQFVFAIRYSKTVTRYRISSSLVDSSKGFLIFFFIVSLVSGHFAHYSETSFMYIALLASMESKIKMVHKKDMSKSRSMRSL